MLMYLFCELYNGHLGAFIKLELSVWLLLLDRIYDVTVRVSLPLEEAINLQQTIIMLLLLCTLETSAKCQSTPLPTRRHNHGEVALTIIKLHCKLNRCFVKCKCGLLSYL